MHIIDIMNNTDFNSLSTIKTFYLPEVFRLQHPVPDFFEDEITKFQDPFPMAMRQKKLGWLTEIFLPSFQRTVLDLDQGKRP